MTGRWGQAGAAGGLPGSAARMAEVGAKRKSRPQRPSACAHGDLGTGPGLPRQRRPDRLPAGGALEGKAPFYSSMTAEQAPVDTVIGKLRLPPAPRARDPASRCWSSRLAAGRSSAIRTPHPSPRPRPGQRLAPRGVPVRLESARSAQRLGLLGGPTGPGDRQLRSLESPPPRCCRAAATTRSPSSRSRSSKRSDRRTWRSGSGEAPP